MKLRQALHSAAAKKKKNLPRAPAEQHDSSHRVSRHVEHQWKKKLFDGIDNSCNLPLGCKNNETLEHTDSKSWKDISGKMNFTNRPCATWDCLHHKKYTCVFFDRYQNYSYRFASHLLLMFPQTANKTDYRYDLYRCRSNEQDDKYEVTPDNGQMFKLRSTEWTNSESPKSLNTQGVACQWSNVAEGANEQTIPQKLHFVSNQLAK